MGTIQTDSFIAVGNQDEAGIGRTYENIYLVPTTGYVSTGFKHVGGKKANDKPQYLKVNFMEYQISIKLYPMKNKYQNQKLMII